MNSQSCWHGVLRHYEPCLNFLRYSSIVIFLFIIITIDILQLYIYICITNMILFFCLESVHLLRQSKRNCQIYQFMAQSKPFFPRSQGEPASRSKINESYVRVKEICMSRYMLLSAFKINEVLYQQLPNVWVSEITGLKETYV